MRGVRVEVVSETIECHFLAGKKEQIGAEGASTDTAYSPPSAVASNNRPHIHVTLLKNYCQKTSLRSDLREKLMMDQRSERTDDYDCRAIGCHK